MKTSAPVLLIIVAAFAVATFLILSGSVQRKPTVVSQSNVCYVEYEDGSSEWLPCYTLREQEV